MINFASMYLRDVKRFAEYSARPEVQQAARDEIIRRSVMCDYAEPRTERQP